MVRTLLSGTPQVAGVDDVAALAVDHRRVFAATKILLNPKTFSKIV